jgi:hypothetical protein
LPFLSLLIHVLPISLAHQSHQEPFLDSFTSHMNEWMHDDKENSNTCVDTAETWHSFCMLHEGSIRYSYLGCLEVVHATLMFGTWCFAYPQVESDVAFRDCTRYTLWYENPLWRVIDQRTMATSYDKLF